MTRGVLSRQVCLGYTGHFFDDLPECSHVHGGPYLGLTATIHNNSTKSLFLIGAEKRIVLSFAPFALSMVILPRQARGKQRECTQKEEMHFSAGDYKTTIAAYKTNMAKFDASNHPFIAIKPVRSLHDLFDPLLYY